MIKRKSFENVILNAFEQSGSTFKESTNSSVRDVKVFASEKVYIFDMVGKETSEGKDLKNTDTNQLKNALGKGKGLRNDFEIVDVLDQGKILGEGGHMVLEEDVDDEIVLEKERVICEVKNMITEGKDFYKEVKFTDKDFSKPKDLVKMNESVGQTSKQISNIFDMVHTDLVFEKIVETREIKIGRKERLKQRAYNCVYEDLEDELLMESGKVDFSLDDVMNDISNEEI